MTAFRRNSPPVWDQSYFLIQRSAILGGKNISSIIPGVVLVLLGLSLVLFQALHPQFY